MGKPIISNDRDVILIDKYVKSADNPVCDGNHYKGLRIHALEGLHEFIIQKIKATFKANSSILDVGSGTGAMSLRLFESGFKVTAADIVSENFKLHNVIPFVKSNFNEKLSDYFDNQFDGIVAVEIIEHLENPRMFLRECLKLLHPGGVLIISTPNIDNPISKASFIRYGTYQWYYDADYRNEGHITPISQWLLKKCISETGFNLIWAGTFGDPFKCTKNWWKMRLFAKFMQIFSNVNRNLSGEILIAILRKRNDPE